MLGAKKTLKDATYPPTGPLGDRLFRNDLVVGADGKRTLHFTDVTGPSGINVTSCGMGVAVADYDNDGFVDIYRTGLSGSVLLHNNGNGMFTDVTTKTGVGNPNGWGVPAAFLDYDRDGWLDLFVGNYLLHPSPATWTCQSPASTITARRTVIARSRIASITIAATHLRGRDVACPVGGADGPALGVSTADFNGDGWIDIYVGNDGQPNQLWINQKNGTFKDTAFISGAAVNGQGNSEASMGIDAGDYDNDGDEDIFITNWLAQMNILYVNMGGGVFEDRKAVGGRSAEPGEDRFRRRLVRLRQRLVVLTAHRGSVSIIEAQARVNDPFPLKMLNQLYRNLGNGRFEDVSTKAGKAFTLNDVSRGAAFGDIDNDGDEDVVIGTAAGPARLLINNIGNKNHWVGLRLVRPVLLDGRDKPVRTSLRSPPASYGGPPEPWRRGKDRPTRSDRRARRGDSQERRIAVAPRAIRWQLCIRQRSANCSSDWGTSTDPCDWPSGKTEEFEVPVDRWTTLTEGTVVPLRRTSQ